VGLFAAVFACEKAYNYDLWWHLRAGQWMLENGQILRQDLFSFSTNGAPWMNYSWLWSVSFAWLHGLFGISGLVLVKALLIAIGFGIAAYSLVRRGVSPFLVMLLLGAAVPMARFRFMLRPQSMVFLGLALLIVLLSGRNEHRYPRMFWLLPITLLWANLHPSSFLIPVFALLLVIELLIDHVMGRLRQLNLLRALMWPAAISVGTYLCLLVTPWGFEAHQLVIERMLEDVVAKTYWVEEHQPLKWGTHLGFTTLMALTALSFLPIWRRARIFYLGIFFATAYLAISGVRYAGLASLAHAFVLAENIHSWLKTHRDRLPTYKPQLIAVSASLALLIGAVVTFMTSFDDSKAYKWGLGGQQNRFPVQAVNQLSILPVRRVFNTWEVGGYLLWRLPKMQHYVDGRGLREQFALVEQVQAMNPVQFKFYLDENKVDAALLLKNDVLFNHRFQQLVDFESVAFDNLATVYVRKDLTDEVGNVVAEAFRFIKPGTYDYTYLVPLAQGPDASTAEDELRRALSMTPQDFSINFLLGFFLEVQDRDEALQHYLKSIDLNPSLAFTHYGLGLRATRFAVRKQFWVDAIKLARKALDWGEDDEEIHFLLATSLQQAGNIIEAERIYRAIVAEEEAMPAAHANLGFLLLDSERARDAIDQFREALRKQHGFESADYGLALATEKAGDHATALKLWESFLKDHPESRWAGRAREALDSPSR